MTAFDYLTLFMLAIGFGIVLTGIALAWCALLVAFGEWATKAIHRWLTWS